LDKTGTLTRNKMTVSKVFSGMMDIRVHNGHFILEDRPIDLLSHRELRHLIHVCALCNETKINGNGRDGEYELSGSPTENALVDFALCAGIDVKRLRKEHKLLKVQYRSESRLFMSTLHASTNSQRLFAMKGSPPEVLSMCRWQIKDGKTMPISEEDRLKIEAVNDQMAADTLRVLGLAYATVDSEYPKELEEDLIWLGLVGMEDPIRDGVKGLMDVFHGAGINTVMITGDQSPTAYAVANELNLSQDERLEILDSTQFDTVDPELMGALAKKVHVYSRVSPAHKLRIVQALQDAGKVVAMTGDGINDGPALKASDIGIAMGQSGTDVAREVADIVLEDDDLEALVIAVRDGRATFNNIKKSVHFFLATNLSEIMVMFAAVAGGIGFPLNVMQLLWINIISDIFPGLALSMEEPESDVLEQPPRDPDQPLFSGTDYKRMVFESSIISASSLGAYAYGIANYGIGARASSIAFQGLTIGQLLHALSCRSPSHRIFDKERLPRNRYLDLALGGSLAVQVMTMFVPTLRRFLGLTPLNLLDIAVIGGSSLVALAINETSKKPSRDER
jgi:Ca2+-transporting ATPase